MSSSRPPSSSAVAVSAAAQSDFDPQSSTLLIPPTAIENALHARMDFSPLCPSARTSYTRVDLSGSTGANTPRRDIDLTVDMDDDRDRISPTEEEMIPQSSQVTLTFLLLSGRRRTMSFEPETTVGRVKEIVWNTWPNDWRDERPPMPSYLRILYLGQILQDGDSLDKLAFPTQQPSSASSAIVHLSIRPYAPPEEEPRKKRPLSTVGAGTDEETRAGCCSACIIC